VIGQTLSHYRITAALGAGGMGEAYRAKDLTLDREVAIRILPDVFAHDSERVARFTREAKTLASLNHPNLAQIYGILEEGPSPQDPANRLRQAYGGPPESAAAEAGSHDSGSGIVVGAGCSQPQSHVHAQWP
jgi:serine/threonine protein kinase